MRAIFGVPTSSITLVLVVLFALTIGTTAALILRNRVIFKLGIRNVPRRPAQTILIVIGLMLSTLIISAAFTTGDTLSSSIRGEVLDITRQTDERVVKSVADTDSGPQ